VVVLATYRTLDIASLKNPKDRSWCMGWIDNYNGSRLAAIVDPVYGVAEK
jgi:hypothetical protein